MRVVIIASPYPLEECPAPPLGVTYVAAAFEEAGAEVKILDYIVSRYTPQKLEAELAAFRPDLVGSTSVTLNFPAAASIVRKVKEIDPSIVTVMGGPHVTFDAENTLRSFPEIDLLVLGEGEKTIRELTPFIRDRKAWSHLKGIAFRDGEEVVKTPPNELIQDLDALPLPARHLLPVSRYQALGFPVSIITSRGCPCPCIFCQGRRMVGSKVRNRSPEKVVDEIEEILSYGFSRINIADDLFVSNKARARKVCEEIIRRGLAFTWSAFSRVDTVDPDTFKLMRKAGCDTVGFGIETGVPEMLKRIRKGITRDQARKAVAICKEAGMGIHASFIAGLPGESMATLRETEAFAKSLDIPWGFHILAPFPGTTIREEIDRYDLEILTNDWSRYDANRAVTRTSHLSPEEVERFVAEVDEESRILWEEMTERYRSGTATVEETLRVSGRYRMHLTYRLFAEDILEDHCRFPLRNLNDGPRSAEALLYEKVTHATGCDKDLVTHTMRDFIDRGYIKTRQTDSTVTWYWTHNKQKDVGPFSYSAS